MMNQGYKKYKPFTPIDLPDRQWPNRVIDHAPIWCSVDLRDGNQALVDPMNLEEKLEYFKTLIAVGFKEIEVGFPSASETEYEILRTLIDGHYIPDDVTIQVLVQAREHLMAENQKEPTVEEIAQISPMCSIMVANAMGMMAMMAVTSRFASQLPMREKTVFSIFTGRPIHAALATPEKSTRPVTAA